MNKESEEGMGRAGDQEKVSHSPTLLLLYVIQIALDEVVA